MSLTTLGGLQSHWFKLTSAGQMEPTHSCTCGLPVSTRSTIKENFIHIFESQLTSAQIGPTVSQHSEDVNVVLRTAYA